MDSRTYYYARVSSKEQNLDRQIAAFVALGARERETIRKRQTEGIEAAKQSGKKLGRPALTFPANWQGVYSSWRSGGDNCKGGDGTDWNEKNQLLQIGQYDGKAVKQDTVCAGHISLLLIAVQRRQDTGRTPTHQKRGKQVSPFPSKKF